MEASGIFPSDGLFDNPYRWQMHYRFSNGVTWHWTDCDEGSWGTQGTQPKAPADWPQHRMGIRLEGTEGWVFIWRGTVDAHPKSLLQVRIGPRDKVQLARSGGAPIPDFIECVKTHRPTCAPVEVAQRSTNLCSIAAISMQLRRRVVWNPLTEEFVNDAEANRLKTRTMRQPCGV